MRILTGLTVFLIMAGSSTGGNTGVMPHVNTALAESLADAAIQQVRARMREIVGKLKVERYDDQGMTLYNLKTEGGSLFMPSMSRRDGSEPYFAGYVVYDGKGSIDMKKAIVLVGNRRYECTLNVIPHRDSFGDGRVNEAGTFSVDTGLVRAIVLAPADTEIQVRLDGSRGHCDFKPSETSRQGWKDLHYYYVFYNLRDTALEAARTIHY